jgi:hypothetical protein
VINLTHNKEIIRLRKKSIWIAPQKCQVALWLLKYTKNMKKNSSENFKKGFDYGKYKSSS